ncbi:MAG: hypothetical protein PVI23_16555, partial [Maricaulaceae bacterium]
LILVAGRLVSQEALVEAFVYRSGRLLGEDAIESLLDHAAGHSEALAALVELEDNIVGDANKSRLAGLIRARLVHMPVETHFLRGRAAPTGRLAELATLRRDVDATSFTAQDRAEIGEIIDRYATTIENEAKLFDQIARRSTSAIEAAATLLKLVDGGVTPAGRLAEAARTRAKELLASEGAKAELLSGDPAPRALAEELTRRLAKDDEEAAA